MRGVYPDRAASCTATPSPGAAARATRPRVGAGARKRRAGRVRRPPRRPRARRRARRARRRRPAPARAAGPHRDGAPVRGGGDVGQGGAGGGEVARRAEAAARVGLRRAHALAGPGDDRVAVAGQREVERPAEMVRRRAARAAGRGGSARRPPGAPPPRSRPGRGRRPRETARPTRHRRGRSSRPPCAAPRRTPATERSVSARAKLRARRRPQPRADLPARVPRHEHVAARPDRHRHAAHAPGGEPQRRAEPAAGAAQRDLDAVVRVPRSSNHASARSPRALPANAGGAIRGWCTTRRDGPKAPPARIATRSSDRGSRFEPTGRAIETAARERWP